MPSYEQTPGTLNLVFNRANDLSALVDFSIPVTGYTFDAAIISLVTSTEVQPLTITVVDAAAGKLNVSVTDTEAEELSAGTYGWFLRSNNGGTVRTELTGFIEVLP